MDRTNLRKVAASRPRYTLNQLLAQCKPSAARTKEEREWLSDKPIGNELVWILIDRPDQGLPVAGGVVIGPGRDLRAELLGRLLKRAQGQWGAAGVEAVGSVDLGNAQGAAPPVEHVALPLPLVNPSADWSRAQPHAA